MSTPGYSAAAMIKDKDGEDDAKHACTYSDGDGERVSDMPSRDDHLNSTPADEMDSLQRLPQELLEQILTSLNAPDRRSLYMTCRELFKRLRLKDYPNGLILREDEASGASLNAIAKGPYRELVTTITYSPRDPLRAKAKLPDGEDNTIELHQKAKDALRTLGHAFPKLVEFRVELSWNPHLWSVGADALLFSKRVGLLSDSFQAILESEVKLERLHLSGFPPFRLKCFHFFFEEPWQRFLNPLTSFTIVLLGVSNLQLFSNKDEQPGMPRFNISRLPTQLKFVKSFNRIFLKHLINVEHLRIAGNYAAFMEGVDGNALVPFDRVARLPRLTSFEYEYGQIDGGLIKFLFEHRATLQRLYIGRCLSNCWPSLLESLSAHSEALMEFTIAPFPAYRRPYTESGEHYEVVRTLLELREVGPREWTYHEKYIPNDRRCLFASGALTEDGTPQARIEREQCNGGAQSRHGEDQHQATVMEAFYKVLSTVHGRRLGETGRGKRRAHQQCTALTSGDLGEERRPGKKARQDATGVLSRDK